MSTLFLMLLALGAQSAGAVPPRAAWASSAAATTLSDDPACSNVALLRLADGDAFARLYLPDGGWGALLGDADGDQAFDLPAGLDGLAHVPGAGAAHLLELWFSTDSDFQGWKDGDVLRIGAGGAIERVIAEDDLRAALGTVSALDLDAIERDTGGLLWFSLRDGVSASLLGPIEDGDVLVYDAAAGAVVRHASEAEVQAWVDQASPGLGAIGDLKSLAFDPQTGDLLFTVQSPSSDDATVFGAGGGGALLPGFGEADWGFTTATELDALTFPTTALAEVVVLTGDSQQLVQGQAFALQAHHATPGGRIYGLAGTATLLLETQRGGFHLAAFDPSGPVRAWPSGGPWLADASGRATANLTAPTLPPGLPSATIVYQAQDLSGKGLSTPWIVRVQ